MNKTSKAIIQERSNEFIKKTYDRINLTVPKGEKQIIAKAASNVSESVNEYIRKAVRKRMNEEKEDWAWDYFSKTLAQKSGQATTKSIGFFILIPTAVKK